MTAPSRGPKGRASSVRRNVRLLWWLALASLVLPLTLTGFGWVPLELSLSLGGGLALILALSALVFQFMLVPLVEQKLAAFSVAEYLIRWTYTPAEWEAFAEAEYRQHLMARSLKIMQAQFHPTTWQACWEHVALGRAAAEVAADLGISAGTVYVAKARILSRLRVELHGLLD